MKEDAFLKFHPFVNLVFFIGAICLGVILWHPVYLLVGILVSGIYYFLLNGRKGLKIIGMMIPLFLFITFFNPIVNTRGVTILFRLFGRPYTLEALLYGVVVAAIFVIMMLWFGCYNKILTSDRFTCLFSNFMPSIALLLVMVLRMIPNLLKKAKQIIGVRSSIGKGTQSTASVKEKVTAGATVLGVLTSWALEGSVVTGDSMRARGYATSKRTSFMVYHMTGADWSLIGIILGLLGIVIGFMAKGHMFAEFVPEVSFAPIGGVNIIGFIAYTGFLMIPVILDIKEAIQWYISKYRI